MRTPLGLLRQVLVESIVAGHRLGVLVWSTPKTHELWSVPFPAVLANELVALMLGKDRESLVLTQQRGRVLRDSGWPPLVFQPAARK